MTLLLRQGRLIDPARQLDTIADLVIDQGRIVDPAQLTSSPDNVIDCTGWIIAPGFIDTHVATRDPGYEEDETTRTATAAALAGGFTTIAALPDTQPVVDNRAAVEFVVLQADRARHCRVLPLGAVTRDHNGSELADLGQMAAGGAVGYTDAKTSLASAEVLRRALEYALMFGRPILTHPQDPTLTAGGVMHEGYYSTLLGLRGMPAAAEEITVSRDIALAELTGGKIHLMCLSTAGSVEQLRRAKARGLSVTADVAVHHLVLTDAALQTYDANYKVNPPLRTSEHQQALLAGLQDGTIDALTTDHSPLASEKKDRELDFVPFGIVGLETALPLAIEALVTSGLLTWLQLIDRLSTAPARILGIEGGTLAPGTRADLTLIDPTRQWTIDPAEFRSRSRNTPFRGRQVTGRVMMVLVGGDIRFQLPVSTTASLTTAECII